MKFLRTFLYLLILALAACTHSSKKIPAFNQSFAAYISSFSSGVISKKATIHITFSRAVTDSSSADLSLSDDLLVFEPKISGKLLLHQNTLEFIPDENLKPGQIYTARLHLGELLKVPDSLAYFEFGFQVLRPDFEWGPVQLLATPQTQMNWYKLTGKLISADQEDLEDVKKIIEASVGGKHLAVKWQHGDLPLEYTFEIDSLKREESSRQIVLNINKDLKGTEHLESKKAELAALGDFKFLDYSILKNPTGYVRLNFSDPIDQSQDLSGLITLEGEGKLRFEVENTAILVYPEEDVYGSKLLTIFPGIKNILGYKFKEQKNIKLEFLNEKPQVRIIGDGNIIPVSDKLMLPFQAISLKAVDVKVVKIPENNILQFLQTNNYNGENELYRVGEVVATKKVDLISKGSLKDWNTYSIDISKLVRPEAGAIYRVYLSFSKDYSIYECETEPGEQAGGDEEDEYRYYDDYYYYDQSDNSAYNRDDYYFTYPRGYRWKERNNPCHVSYYNSENFVARNLLATNLGLIVKKTETGELDFTVTDMVDNQPVSGASIILYNYQGRQLADAKTDNNGWTRLQVKNKPYFAVAAKGSQKTYLKLQEGEALSLSDFQVEGSNVKDGLKGFIYGERGVWRPGDTLFLNFILEDELSRLPEGHPINFSLSDPRGMVMDQQVKYKGDDRIYNFTTLTNASAITGNYMARVRIGDRVFEQRVRVETVKPNRLKVDLDFGKEILLTDGSKTKASLAVNWLTGIPAANARVEINASINEINSGFDKWPGYTFNDPVRKYEASEKQVFEGNVNEDGKAGVELDLGNFNNAPGMLRARFVVKAFEGGGDFSTEYFDKKIAPYDKWVGMKMPEPKSGRFLQTDRYYELKLKTLDAEGNPISIKNLQVKIYKIDWHWWYNSEKENLARFTNNEVTYLVSQGRASTFNGDGTFKFKINYPLWGRFLIRVCDTEGGHCTGQIAWFDWPESRQGERPELAGATLLNFSTDKEKYKIGEDIVAKIPVGDKSRVLITIETGSGILSKEWVIPQGDILDYHIKATADMAPNIYISASLLQPHAQTTNDRPMRLYGVVPVSIYNPATELQPVITTKEVWRPETKVQVKVSEKKGRAMTYTLAIVDDGLLNLTRFKTPDPWNHFYAKEALGIKTWDMYNDVLGAFGGRLEQVFAIGGDEALIKSENSNQNRFVPMVRFLGPFKLKANASANHEIAVPNYVGAVRVMVVAADAKSAYGNAEKSVKVRKPLMVLTSLPRLLSPGDEVSLPVTVFAMEDQVRNVSLSLQLDGDVEAVGETAKKVSFTKNGEKVIDFKLKVPKVWGKAKVRVEASAGSESAHDETLLKVRLPNPPISEAISFTLMPGKDTVLEYSPLGVEETNSITVEASTIPLIDLSHRLHYLFGYPYGCTEQTVSSAFPLLYLDDIMELSNNMVATKKQNVQIALQKIYERQNTSGAIAYWPGYFSNHYNDYVTSYAGHFMIEAEHKGFQIAKGIMVRWKKYQQGAARNWRPQYDLHGRIWNDLDQSYRLYTLALYKEAEIGAMNRLREIQDLHASTLWQLAASYLLVGQKNEAAKLAQRAQNLNDNTYTGNWYYGGSLRDMSIELMVLNELGRKTEALALGREVAKKLNEDSWYTTHSLAFGLISILQTYGDYAKKEGNIRWVYTAGSETYHGESKGSFQTYEVQKDLDHTFQYTLTNRSQVPVNYSVTATGTPIKYDLPAYSSNLRISVKYALPNGKPIDETKIRQGQDFMAEVTISRTGNAEGYENMALSQLFPTGWEIINTRLLETGEKDESTYDYRDIRDDRVYTFFSLQGRPTVHFRVKLNATYAGRFYLPPVEASDMYNHDIRAREPGKWVEVIR